MHSPQCIAQKQSKAQLQLHGEYDINNQKAHQETE